MRILAMLHLYTPAHNAGAEMTAHALLRALVDAGHEVDVVLSREHPKITTSYTVDGVRVWPQRGKGDPFQWIGTDQPPDVLVAHLENAERAAVLGEMYRIPVVQILHNTHLRAKVEMGWPALAVANTQWMADDYQAWFASTDTTPPPMIVVHPPVFVEDYRTQPGDHITLVNLCPEKGADTFYQVAQRLPEKKFLGVIGAYGEQDIRDMPNVEIVDHAPDMPTRVYSRTKILLVPSDYESYGRVAIEAACSGIPVIAHPTPGLKESLGEAGVFCDREDIDGWVKQIKRLSTPRGWAAASKQVLARVQALDPAQELSAWCAAVEKVRHAG